MKIFLTSSSAMVFGCLCPIIGFFAGRVTSMVSVASLRSSIFFSNSLFRSSSFFSSISLASFTSWPTFGLSSGATSLRLLRTCVNSPFLPRKLTLASLSFSLSAASSICFSAASIIAFNFSFISFLQSIKKPLHNAGANFPCYHPDSCLQTGSQFTDNGCCRQNLLSL